ncbi:MAG: hypothetical protein Q4G47_01040 [Lachnospiraceae bacterium]|nr:hypothetical protein [Lachnospiraceae bacterium]
MKHIKMRSWIILTVMALVLLTGVPGCEVMAADYETGVTKTVTARYVYHTPISWDMVYSDDYFFLPSDQYHHELARLSLGLALSAFRDILNKDAQDDNLISFLQDAGFADLDTHSYKTDPTPHSVGYGIGHKMIGDTELVVLTVCGGCYGVEWVSNVTVGESGAAHKGFSDSAQIVAEYFHEYLEKYSIGKEAKLWIAGYSRGAAISNLLAAEITDSGRFSDVYAYTFATPRNTTEPGDYSNIFNIIRKDDPVPKVPLAEWGFKRNGNDLLLVSSEADADSEEIISRTADLYKEMTGSVMVQNPEIIFQVRTIMDYLLYLFPDPQSYARLLQPVLADIIAGSDGTSALETLAKAMNSFSGESKENENVFSEFQNYLSELVNIYLLRNTMNELPPRLWNPVYGMENLFTEHVSAKYLAQMYASDDPDKLFSDNTEYVHLVIYGEADAEIYDGDRLIRTVPADGNESPYDTDENYTYPNVARKNNRLVIALSAERSYTIKVTSRSYLFHTLSYTGNFYSGDTVRVKTDPFYMRLMHYGDTLRIVTSGDGRVIDPEKSNYTWCRNIVSDSYMPSVAVKLENNDKAYLTYHGVMTFLMISLRIFLVQLIATIVLAYIRKRRAAGRNIPFTAVWHGVNVLLFIFCELSIWYFISAFPMLKRIPMIMALITLLALSWKLYRQNDSGGMLRTFYLYVVLLAAFGIINGFFSGKFGKAKAVIIVLTYIAFFTAALLLFRKREGAAAE